jgi:AAA family ATP:ADP antiporter
MMIERLARILHLEPGEARHGLGFGAALFTLTCSYTLIRTARDALFLAQLPASRLPMVYLAVGVLSTVTAALYSRATRTQLASRSLEIGAWTAALSLVVFAYLSVLGRALGLRWVPVAFYLWVNVYGLILVSQYWSVVNSVTDPHEAKRILGLVGTGGILGGLVGGALAMPLSRGFGVEAMVIAGAAMNATVAIATRLAAATHARVEDDPALDPPPPGPPFANPYVRWLAIAALCSVLVTTLLDYQFKVEIQRRYSHPAEIASFIGFFYTATNLAALVMQLFLARWLLHRLGAAWTAAVLPAGLAVGAAFTLAFPGFLTVMATRLWDQVLRTSVNKTAVELFFFPLTPAVRRRAKAWIEAGIERIGDAIAGLIIIVTASALAASPMHTAAALALHILPLVAVWAIAWVAVRRGYVTELARNLRRLNLRPRATAMNLRESGALREMIGLLASPHEQVVVHGIEMLEDNAPEELDPVLERLIDHPASTVRVRALAIAGARGLVSRETVDRLLHDPDPEIRIGAMRLRVAEGGEDPLERIEEFLGSPDPRLRRSALLAVAELAPSRDDAHLRRTLERLLETGGVADRVAIAEALGRRPRESALHDMLRPLLDDASLEVRSAALRSVGRTGGRTLVPELIEALAARPTQVAARDGLAAFGDRVAGTLGDYLADATVSIPVRREIPRVLSRIGTPDAVQALFRYRGHDDVWLSYRVLKAMNHIRIQRPAQRFPDELVTADLELDAKSFLLAFVHYRSCPIGSSATAERLLCITLNERMDQALNRIFRRLALLYPAADIYAAYRGIVSPQPRARGSALEYLENALHGTHAATVLPLVDDRGDQERLRHAELRHGYRYTSYRETLNAILEQGDAWLRACALYVVGMRGERDLMPVVERNLDAHEPYVRETAAWALSRATAG